MKKVIGILALCLLIGTIGCKKEEVHNHVTIDIHEPAEGSTVSNASQTHIHIDFTAEQELHDIEVTLTDSSGTAIAPFNPMDIHNHSTSHTLEQDIDLSAYPAGASFTLTVEACEDHDCAEKVTDSVQFNI